MTRERINWGVLFTIFWLLLFVVMLNDAAGWSPTARRFPVAMLYLGIGLVTVQVLLEVARMIWPRVDEDTETFADLPVDRSVPLNVVMQRFGGFAIWLAVLLLTMRFIGLALAFPLLVVAFIFVHARDRWWVGLIIGGTVWLVVAFVFAEVLNMPMPRNRLF